MTKKPYQEAGEVFYHDGGAKHTIYAPLATVASGEVIVGDSAAVLPTIACKMVYFRTSGTNAGTIYIGGAGVTAPNGTLDATTGFPLIANEQLGPIPIANVNQFYGIASAASQGLIYLAVS